MKKPAIVLFGRIPPPVGGESVMIERSLRALREEFKVYHVNAVLSPTDGAIGKFEILKILKIFGYVAQALWFRFRHGATVLYYFPAPPKLIAFYRDLIVLGFCRPLFGKVIFHWQSSGLGAWIEERASTVEKMLAAMCYHGHAGSIVTTDFDRRDATFLKPKAIEVVPNSIEDRCSDFEAVVLPARQRRLEMRQRGEGEFRILFLSLCIAEKGLFSTLEAMGSLSQKWPGPLRLDVCGDFRSVEERRRFEELSMRLRRNAKVMVEYHGFVDGDQKDELFRQADVFSLPTSYPGEAFPVAMVEAMCFGLPIVTTRWKGIPSVLPENYRGLCDSGSEVEVADAFEAAAGWGNFTELRNHYLQHFEFSRFSEQLRCKINKIVSKIDFR